MYIDTSVIAAFYCPEPLSEEADRLLTSTEDPTLSNLADVELHSAVARKARMGEMEVSAARRVLTAFRSHLEHGYYRRLSLRPKHFTRASDRLSTFSVPLRTLDALHIAVALAEDLELITADATMASAMRSFGGSARLLTSDGND